MYALQVEPPRLSVARFCLLQYLILSWLLPDLHVFEEEDSISLNSCSVRITEDFIVKLFRPRAVAAHVFARTQSGCTALMHAALEDHPQCVRVLVDFGADVDATDCVRE